MQLPCNPSLSFTLSACHTQMKLTVTPEAGSPGLHVLYDGQPRPSFEPKIKSFFAAINLRFPWLANAFVEIDSINTFPHSAGIASSASAMSAMALCLFDIHDQMNEVMSEVDAKWLREASEIARLGSGSASRSVFPYAALWGESSSAEGSSDSYAIPWENHMAPLFKNYQDTILIVSTKEKSVSSTQGHAMMEDLPFAKTRYAEARQNLSLLVEHMKNGDDLEAFISIVESEALQLHALMMAGKSPFILMEPGTIAVIKEIWRFRQESGLPVCFTLDAGPNVHLLYPKEHAIAVLAWIKTSLAHFCHNGQYILDQVGSGPERISSN